MSISIDDTAYPAPGALPTFVDVPNDKTVRRDNGTYVHKFNASQAFAFAAGAVVTVPAAERVQLVSAELVISAPA